MTPRRLRALALGTISVVALAVIVAVYELPHLKLGATPTPAAVPVASAPLETKEGELIDFDFLSPSLGWAVATATSDDLWIFFTPDGARHWRNLTVITGAGFGPPQLHVIDAKDLWVLAQGKDAAPLVYTSADGGFSWTQVVLPDSPVGHIGFSDPFHGWATVLAQPSRLYVTDDRGVTWRRAADPPLDFGSPVFRNPNEGWLSGIARGYAVYASVDGGQSWQPREMQPGADFDVFESVTLLPGGALLVDASPQCGATCPPVGETVFVSLDDGASWRMLPALPGGAQFGNVSIQDASNWWVIQGNVLYKTRDAGQDWTVVSRRVEYDQLIPRILDARHAWALVRLIDDSQPNRRPFPAFELDVTSDGGLNWKTVPVPVPG